LDSNKIANLVSSLRLLKTILDGCSGHAKYAHYESAMEAIAPILAGSKLGKVYAEAEAL
jgi:hypothetical protein